MSENLSQAVEDYLKVIYEITQGGDKATTKRIAERMGVAPASVTGMLQKLAGANPALVDYQKHRGVALTRTGKKHALEVIRHHRLLELFLQQKLGYSWDQVHGEADRLEHVISEDLEERMAQALGDPAYDPHGEPIPSREFKMPDQSAVRLSELRLGDRATVLRVQDADSAMLRYLGSIGVTPNAQINILDYSAFDGNLSLQLSGQEKPLVLGPSVTSHVFVQMQ